MPDGTHWLTHAPDTLKAVKPLYHEIDIEAMQVANEDTRYAKAGT